MPTKNIKKKPRLAAGKLTAQHGVARRTKRNAATSNAFPVVGIGASAGGLAAISALLNALPEKADMAFIVISHLSAGSESILDTLLANESRMPVCRAAAGDMVEPNRIYVGPPGQDVEIHDRVLRLTPSIPQNGPCSIDHLFVSLAAACGAGARGVVLSGSGSDGTRGLAAIRAHGGITYAQEPGGAQFDQMPVSAINAGCVDCVLTPAGIAQHLLETARKGNVQSRARRFVAAVERDTDYTQIIAALPQVTGVDFSLYKAGTLQRRIAKRMAQKGFSDPAAYLRHVQSEPQESRALFADLLIRVSSFFRDPDAFRALERKVIAPLLSRADASTPIRVWVPGCARGDEVYSIGMLLLERAARLGRVPRIQLFGSDISAPDIDAARIGRFEERIAAEMPAARLNRFFQKVPDGYQVRPDLRELCVFACHEVGSDPPFSNLDLISCRNLLIYFGRPLQERVLDTFHFALKPSGALFLGRSESLGGRLELFSMVDRKYRIYRSKPPSGRRALHRVLGRSGVLAPLPPPAGAAAPVAVGGMERTLLDRYAPPGLYLDEDLLIRSFIGDVSAYLQPAAGLANLQLGRMLPAGAALDIRTAIRAAGKSQRPVRREIIWIAPDGATREVTLLVMRVVEGEGRKGYLVMFEPPAAAPAALAAAKPLRRRERNELVRMSRQLSASREQIQTVIEEQERAAQDLRSAHEEALSANEELQSSNEELQTAKEELQSANEELATVNEELQERNQQLDRLAGELGMLIAGVNISIVHLDRDKRVRRYSPTAGKLFNLIASDVGREFSQIKPSLTLPELDPLVNAALERGTVAEREVQDRSGRWFSLRVRPFRGEGSRIEGVLIALVDIDATKRSVAGIVETMNEPLLVLDDEFNVLTANSAFYRIFRTTRRDTQDKKLFELGNRQWDIPELRNMLKEVLPEHQRFENFRVERVFPQIGRKIFLLNGMQVVDEGIGSENILLIFQDVTDAEANTAQLLHLAREEEGQRIAHELHDLSGGELASLGLEIARLAQLARQAQVPEIAEALDSAQNKVQGLSSNTHDLARRIHPSVIDDLGLNKALQGECRALSESYAIDTDVRLRGPLDKLPAPVSLCVYRVVQESLRNVVRHSGATQVTVAVEASAREVRVLVQDQGVGFDQGDGNRAGGIGLEGMANRVAALRGSFSITSEPGKGTSIRVVIGLGKTKALVLARAGSKKKS